ncbi:creatininase family protein [Coraliomargarita akajimensis]|uniref:Creatininase n=1 Tax=Coraliomargarita akajimensis (strain DSM 45221 / IAM 15411 / JCM 23193 / KCTC 12865 / 04OKA010-24) TaxID=583355 RepID=D5ELF5_CORAD|nr:creatininase family protein [Coraliomargarita akajimensis]ADE55091.1 Creatininase [Coraliomargarita akajimensis DSM 45221]
MSEPKHSQWSQMTWPEIHTAIQAGVDAVILPLGATEQHGPHLGTGMDSVLADQLCAELGERTQVPVLPTLSYGCSIGHSHRWPGTLALSPTTLIAVLCDIGDWLYRAGVRRIFLVNCHVGNAAPVRCALDTLRCRYDDLMLAALNDGDLTPEIAKEFAADGNDWHANAAETSLMLAKAPEMVRPAVVASADDPDRTADCVFAHPVNRTSTNGVTGSPSRATVAAGEALYETMLTTLVERVERGITETPPLTNSYFETIND